MVRVDNYFIHDNGGRPIRVEVAGTIVRLYRRKMMIRSFTRHHSRSNYRLNTFYNKIVTRVFIGKSPRTPMTECSGNFGPEYTGNSILIEEVDGHYVFVGSETYRFQPRSPIVSFVSPIGINDIPYPYARDTLNNVYLFSKDTILTHCPPDEDDPYNWYYNNYIISADICRGGALAPPSAVHAAENIHFWIPANCIQACRRLTYDENWRNGSSLVGGAVIYYDERQQIMTTEDVAELMERVEARSGFAHLDRLQLLQQRL